jgi:hypothetical protein
VAPRHCELQTEWRSMCPGLKSRSHCPDQPTSYGEHAGYPLCLPVRCKGSGFPSEWQTSGRSSPEKDSCCETLLLWRSEVHSRNLQSILLPTRVKCVDGVLQVTVLGVVPTHQRLASTLSWGDRSGIHITRWEETYLLTFLYVRRYRIVNCIV